ncbi:radical SAM protein, partial [bacterium]|nr:radical SAM protein [bacterium]
ARSSSQTTQHSIYIGTENFCDKELDRLGKGYDYSKIKNLIKILSAKKISQAHHLIFANRDTSLDNIFENLYKICEFKACYENFFHILTPVIPRVVPLYPSAIYKIYSRLNEQDCFEFKKVLHSDEFPNKDYPLVKSVNPRNSYVRWLSEGVENIFTKSNYYETTFENILTLLLMRTESIIVSDKSLKKEIEDAKRVRRLIDKNKYYFKGIKERLDYENRRKIFINTKSNIQIMLTRKCPLRCSYCPIPKKESDMSDAICKRAIDLLFTSKSKNLRVDFTGGEPLLRFGLLKKAINYSIRLAKVKAREVSFYIVTNAIYLSEEVINFLDNKNVLLEISIDGKEELHNKYKIPLKNINPYKLTVGNAKKIQKRKIEAYVVIVASPATVNRLFESFHHVIEVGFNKIEVNYAIGSFWKEDASHEFFKQMDKIISCYEKKLISGEIEFGNMKKRDEPAAVNSAFLIDTDGSIRPLNEFLYKVEKTAATPYKIKTVFDYDSFDDLYMNKFTVYYSLVKMFGDKDENIRKILNNNIEMGIKAKKYFKGVNKHFNSM